TGWPRDWSSDVCSSDLQAGMSIVQEEIFGPVLSVIRTEDLDDAIAQINASGYGNAAVLFTSSGRAAREFRHRVSCGMVGINVGRSEERRAGKERKRPSQ